LNVEARGPIDTWRTPLVRLALVWIGLIALFADDWGDMVHQWWDSSTYNHILLIPPILAWLVQLRARQVSRLAPKAWWPALPLLAGVLLLWLGGRMLEINLVSQFASVLMLQVVVLALLGPRVTAALLFPVAYMSFLVPFGDELIPALQTVTARLAVALTHASGVPAQVDGIFIDTPAGLFRVAEACSGVKFLVAMVALGTLVAHLCFASPWRRTVFMAAAVVVPILANGVRAWGTIFIAQSQGIEFAAGFDHIVYGWVFFALVMGGLLLGAWRFFDRAPEEPLVDPEALVRSPALARLDPFHLGASPVTLIIAMLALAACGAGPNGHSAAWMDRPAQLP
jgi:exosortase A